MRKHTPGPWKIAYKPCSYGKYAVGVMSENENTSIIEKLPNWRPDEVNEANARLIAAAPDLFKSLQNITEELEQQYDFANGEDSIFEKTRIRLIKQSRAAIAKVEGK